MMQLIRSEERFAADYGWLKTRHSFSFGPYYDPDNMNFGALRVFNDDVVAPGEGFGTHPHRNMEIMTYVISGALEHRDSMGNRGVLRAGDVQRMTAGTGIFHSEYNHSGEEPVHFLQIWFEPDRLNLPPSYEQKSFALEAMENRLLPVVSGKGAEGALPIHQDVTVYLSRLAAGRELEFEQEKGRRIYLFVIEGTLQVEEETLHPGDSARITDLHRLTLKSGTDAHFMLMDLA